MAIPSDITLRAATEADLPAANNLLTNAFGGAPDPEMERAFAEQSTALFPVERRILAVDGDRIVGHTEDTTMTLTVPGERTVQANGVAGVAVAPTHRRRGILRAMYTEMHRRAEAAGLPLTIFTASEGTIYGRFGYGPAVLENRVSIDRRFAEFRPTTPDPGGVELMRMDADASPIVTRLYDRWRRRTPGAQEQPEPAWQLKLARFGVSKGLFALVHADGYALYRHERSESGLVADVLEVRTLTTEAHAALWRVLLGLDLVRTVETTLSDDDPLPYLLTDPRLVRTTGRWDGLWLRVMDVPAALSARGYSADLDLVLGVHDPFRAAGGTFALRVRDGVAECEPSTAAPDVELGIDVLGSLYLGAHRARIFAAANRLQAKDSAHLRAFDAAFASDRAPVLGWFF
ncbi:GNAT family N-acetyltransferase [Nocardia blacklockiae]|uniref:GNAT family N-acetyltransferase n=1 Tax=Nocardia blacklockiae TaxID=480036 RepID=UPI0018946F7B|nr:GNAT family N-acetyltransferase [Nocardia blacklockiae]MBF6171646.1 GNAT family N-acetyltransferase [Nocardia blacklockiae]